MGTRDLQEDDIMLSDEEQQSSNTKLSPVLKPRGQRTYTKFQNAARGRAMDKSSQHIGREANQITQSFKAESSSSTTNHHTPRTTPHKSNVRNSQEGRSGAMVSVPWRVTESNTESDDDVIIVQSADSKQRAQDMDYQTLKRIVISVVNNSIPEGMEGVQQVTSRQVLQRLQALYHQDFSSRMLEIQYCLRRAHERLRTSRRSMKVVCPGIRKSDMNTLQPEGWLNDVIINTYMGIVVKGYDEFAAMSSFSYEEILRDKQPSLPRNWKDLKGILIPACILSHWCLMCYLPQSGNIAIYNSMPVTEELVQCANIFVELFRAEANAKSGGSCLEVSNLPSQENEYDCGVYTCMFARCVVCGNSFEITPEQVTEFRKWIEKEIMHGRLITSREETLDCFVASSDDEDDSDTAL